MMPTVGRIVHYFNPALLPHDGNGVGQGPYPAVVTQVWYAEDGSASYCNLKVFAWNNDHYVGSVPELDTKFYRGGAPYWAWPVKAV